MNDFYNQRLHGIKTLAVALTNPETRNMLRNAWHERQRADECLAQNDAPGFICHMNRWFVQMPALQRKVRSLGLLTAIKTDWPDWLKNLPKSPA